MDHFGNDAVDLEEPCELLGGGPGDRTQVRQYRLARPHGVLRDVDHLYVRRAHTASFVTLTTCTSGAPNTNSPSQCARTPAITSVFVACSYSRWVAMPIRGFTFEKRYPSA
jgi:hypothetical protein